MFKRVKSAVGKRFNVKRWIGYDGLKDQAKVIKDLYTDVSPVKERERLKAKKQNMSFDEMLQLHQMTDNDVAKRIASEKKMFWGYLAFSLLPLLYGIYLFTLGMVLGGIVALLAFVLVLAYAYRSQVYIYQLTHRQLSVNFKQVVQSIFKK